jgi:hypothetical protein
MGQDANENGRATSSKYSSLAAAALLFFTACTGDDGADGKDAEQPATPDALRRNQDSRASDSPSSASPAARAPGASSASVTGSRSRSG